MFHTRRAWLLCLSSLYFGSAAAAVQNFSIEDLVDARRISEPAVSPDGRSVAFTVRETDRDANRGRTDIWVVDLAPKNAPPRRVTSHGENDSSPVWSPDSRTLYFLSERSGSSQVWRLPLSGGEAQEVTHYPTDVNNFTVSPDGAKLALSMDVFPDCADLKCTADRLKAQSDAKAKGRVYERLFIRHWGTWDDGTQSHLYVAALTDGVAAETPIAISGALDADVPSKPFGDNTEYTFTPDSKKVFFNARIKGKSEAWSTNFDIYEAAADGSGVPNNFTADNRAWDAQPIFSPDGHWLAWRAMARPGFESDRFVIMIRNNKTGERRALTQNWDRSVDKIAFAPDGKSIYAVADHFGQHPLWSVDVTTGKPTMLTGPGHVDDFSVAKDQIILAVSSLRSPAQLYRLAGVGDARPIANMNADMLASRRFGTPEQFTFAGANNETVYGYVMRPAEYTEGKKYPVAFIIHGGPQVSFSNAWSYRWNPQTYAGAGYASVFIDFHGSPGYGQAFTDSISGDWGGKPLEDLQKGLAAALEKFPWLDADRVCALGASYGGYMVDWIAGNWSEPFKCLVSHAGVFDNRMMSYTTEELWFDEWEHGGPQYEVPERFEQHNPINDVKQWRVPMLVTHGQLDYRIPYTQGIGAFTALQRRGIPSRLLIFPNENHWILKPANSVQWHREVERWLGEWIGGEGAR